jgi:hypothetical protein
MECGGKRSATPLSEASVRTKSGVAALLCHRSPNLCRPCAELHDCSTDTQMKKNKKREFLSMPPEASLVSWSLSVSICVHLWLTCCFGLAPRREGCQTPRAMLVYAVTIFTGAFLLFQVQPLIGKYLLPRFSGGPGVWTTGMWFFQVLLLGGYALDFGFRPAFGHRISAFGFASLIPPKTVRNFNP